MQTLYNFEDIHKKD